MKTIHTIAAAIGALTAALTIAAAPANAEVFAGSYAVNVANNTNPGLVINFAPITPALNFNLASAGASTNFDLFKLYTNESSVELDDLLPKTIQVNFTFTAPSSFGGNITGDTVGESFFGIFQDGKVTWNNGGDALLNFAGGGKLLAHLDNATFNAGFLGLDEGAANGAAIHSTFTLVQSAVPETATWGMMMLGFGMIGAGMRVRNRRTAAVTA